MIESLKEEILVFKLRLDLIRAEPDKIEYYITLEKSKLMGLEDESTDAADSQDLATTQSPQITSTPVKSSAASSLAPFSDKKGTARKDALYQERELQDKILELQAEYDVLKKEKDEEIEELKDKVEKLNL